MTQKEIKRKRADCQKVWRDKNIEKAHVTQKRSYENTKPRYLTYQKAKAQKERLTVIKYYSNGKIECNCCGEKIYQFLVIDHMDERYGKGHIHRKSIGRTLPIWLIENNFPEGFQILCHNCNNAKGFYGICPHKII